MRTEITEEPASSWCATVDLAEYPTVSKMTTYSGPDKIRQDQWRIRLSKWMKRAWKLWNYIWLHHWIWNEVEVGYRPHDHTGQWGEVDWLAKEGALKHPQIPEMVCSISLASAERSIKEWARKEYLMSWKRLRIPAHSKLSLVGPDRKKEHPCPIEKWT